MDANISNTSNAPNTTPNNSGEPEKYIRTFEGDIEILKKGGTPDLVPLASPPPAPKERLVAPSPVLPVTPPPSASIPAPAVAPIPTPVAVPEVPKETLKTYSSDFLDKVKEMHASTATVLAAEQDSVTRAPQAEPEKASRGGMLYVIAGVVLLVAGAAGAYVTYSHYLTASLPVMPVLSVSAPIFVDEREQISGTGPALLQAIKESMSRPLASGSVRLLYFANATSTGSVFSALRTSAPGILSRNVNTAGSMAGIVYIDGSQSPFFILSVSSYGNTFAGMLSWESIMSQNLSGIFPAYPAVSVSLASTSSSQATTTSNMKVKVATSTSPAPAFIPAFHDEVVSNHDVRVYRDVVGRSVMLYGYWNQTTLVIARDPSAFTEILKRLATSRTR